METVSFTLAVLLTLSLASEVKQDYAKIRRLVRDLRQAAIILKYQSFRNVQDIPKYT